jgi:hypothetical protein
MAMAALAVVSGRTVHRFGGHDSDCSLDRFSRQVTIADHSLQSPVAVAHKDMVHVLLGHQSAEFVGLRVSRNDRDISRHEMPHFDTILEEKARIIQDIFPEDLPFDLQTVFRAVSCRFLLGQRLSILATSRDPPKDGGQDRCREKHRRSIHLA